MKCHDCLDNFHDNPIGIFLGTDDEGDWFVVMHGCPACRKMSLYLQRANHPHHHQARIVQNWGPVRQESLIRPKGSSRPPCPAEVPPNIRGNYIEPCLVLADGAKAAAALGRRCLQNLLRDHVKVKHGDLSSEIQQVLDSGKLPSGLHESIDAIRQLRRPPDEESANRSDP